MNAETDASQRQNERLRRGVFTTSLDGQTHLMSWPHHLAFKTDDLDSDRLRQLAESGQPAGSQDEVTSALRSGGWLYEEFLDIEGPAFDVKPLRSQIDAPADDPDLDLSRFAVIRREGSALIIESPLARAEIVIHRRRLLHESLGTVPATGMALKLRNELRRWGFLAVPGGDEDTELRLRQWGAHELLFHDRSRLGYRGYVGDGFGGTWWGQKMGLPPEPARPDAFGGSRVKLAEPDLDTRRSDESPYCEVIERRKSIREHDDTDPISSDQLAELLYRTARIRGMHVESGVEFTNAPRPAGGSVYELEIYPLITLCTGIESGFYHYDAHAHELERILPIDDPSVRRMVRVASQGSTTGAIPQVLLVISARVGRVMWKYEGMGYSIVLKNVGVLYHALAGTCSAMNLAGCPLGTDDAAAFTDATGRDPLTECSVGQFIVGSSVIRTKES